MELIEECKSIPPPIQEMLNTLKEGIDSVSLKLMLQESYETVFGIFDHNNELALKHRPLALVAMHPKENPSHYSKMYRTIRRYHKLNIYGTFGMALDRFLEMPHEYVELLFDIASMSARKEGNDVSSVMQQLEKDIQRGG